MSGLGAAVLVAGSLLMVLAALGVIVLPDALARQHAATKSGTLAVALVCIGAAGVTGDLAFAVRLAAIVVFLLATLPVASHLLARAAVVEAGLEPELRAAPLAGEGQGAAGERR